MKNCAIPMVSMAQSAANWRKTNPQVNRMHSLTRLHQHSCNHFVRSASWAIAEVGIWNKKIILRVPEGGGANWSTRRKLQTANQYHILEEKIQRPGWDSNPHPPTLVISSLGQERALRLTHWATNRCFLEAFKYPDDSKSKDNPHSQTGANICTRHCLAV